MVAPRKRESKSRSSIRNRDLRLGISTLTIELILFPLYFREILCSVGYLLNKTSFFCELRPKTLLLINKNKKAVHVFPVFTTLALLYCPFSIACLQKKVKGGTTSPLQPYHLLLFQISNILYVRMEGHNSVSDYMNFRSRRSCPLLPVRCSLFHITAPTTTYRNGKKRKKKKKKPFLTTILPSVTWHTTWVS